MLRFEPVPSDFSRSEEHVIPESLGNTEHVLPPGVVCDVCNNYLSRKVESPFLDSRYIRAERFGAAVPNKRGLIPPLQGVLHLQSMVHVELGREGQAREMSINAVNPRDERRFVEALQRYRSGTLIAPIEQRRPERYIVSRFVAKVALEALALRLSEVPGGLDEVVDKPELEEIRSFVRRGSPGEPWPMHHRRLYPSDARFSEGDEVFEVLHEFDFLYTDRQELFFVLAILGEEFAINVGGRSLEGFEEWLGNHGGRSPLYPSA